MLACLNLELLHLHPPRIQNIYTRDSLVFFFSTNCSALNQNIHTYSTTQSSDIGIFSHVSIQKSILDSSNDSWLKYVYVVLCK